MRAWAHERRPAALAAVQRPMLSHLDPEMHDILLEVVALLRTVYRAEGRHPRSLDNIFLQAAATCRSNH